ncbi:hypothetical protein [Nodosilinea nodulosa]|nr:hypothetical protein [Nodosilinea nodulosa]
MDKEKDIEFLTEMLLRLQRREVEYVETMIQDWLNELTSQEEE